MVLGVSATPSGEMGLPELPPILHCVLVGCLESTYSVSEKSQCLQGTEAGSPGMAFSEAKVHPEAVLGLLWVWELPRQSWIILFSCNRNEYAKGPLPLSSCFFCVIPKGHQSSGSSWKCGSVPSITGYPTEVSRDSAEILIFWDP